jgi:hypothetical protein
MKSLSSTVAGNVVPAVSYSTGSYTLTGLVVGKYYYYSMGANDTSIAFAGGATFAKSASATGLFVATTTSATLAGSGTSAVGTVVAPMLGVPLFPATVTPSLPARLVTVGQFPTANPNYSRQLQISDEYVFVKRGTYAVAFSLADVINLALTEEVNLTWTPPVVLTQPSSVACVATASAVGTLTWDNAAGPSDGDTVTIGTKVYTFKTALTPTEGQVLLNGGGNAALLNLIRAINHTGTPDTDYKCAATNAFASAASSVTSHAFLVTALTAGLAGNAIATTETSANLSWGAATLASGTVAAASFVTLGGSEYTMTYSWYESADGITYGSALTTAGIYNVATPGTLTITPTDTSKSGYYYKCIITDNAGSYGLTNGSITTNVVNLTVP